MIEISNLTVRFGKTRALDAVSMNVGRGESVLLAGANGSGKTTLLRVLAGVLRPQCGAVRIGEKKVSCQTQRKTAYIPSTVSLYDGLKLKEAIRMHASFYEGFAYREIGGCEFDPSRRVGSLSRGEKTLFLLSLALSTSPEYLFIDDVIHLLDPHLRDIFLKSILNLIEEKQLTVLLAAQSSFDIEGVVERVILLEKGKVLLNETVENLKRMFVRVYMRTQPVGVPVVFSREWEGVRELYVYPYSKDLPLPEKVEYLDLPDIMRAFIGGEYDHR